MAEKKTPHGEMPERIYTVPLRAEWLKVPRIERAGTAVATVKGFLSRHMKAGDVKISGRLNEQLWARGLKRPPAGIRVKAQMDEKGVVTARLPDEVVAREEEKGRVEKLKERLGGRKGAGGSAEKPAREEGKEPEKQTEEKREPETPYSQPVESKVKRKGAKK